MAVERANPFLLCLSECVKITIFMSFTNEKQKKTHI